jgi:uncharacterized membrane protein
VNISLSATPKPSRLLSVSIWIAQFLLGVSFVMIGFMKTTTPIEVLAKMIPWTGQLPEMFVRVIGLIDMAGGIGVLLPALTRIKPSLTVWAALGCVCLQICAIIFHLSRGEVSAVPLNLVLLPLAAFIYWGRRKRLPIQARRK